MTPLRRKRRFRKRRGSSFTPESSARANKARWSAGSERRDAEIPERARELALIEIENLPRKPGDPLGCLQWTDFRTGNVTRRIVEIGDRIDRIVIRHPDGKRSRSHGWTWFLEHFRKAVCQHRL